MALSAGAGCGGDDEEATDTMPEPPALTVPDEGSEEPATTPTETAPIPAPEPEPDPAGGTPAPPAEPPPDSPENDAPPPPQSPAERFEEFCNQNPGACGN